MSSLGPGELLAAYSVVDRRENHRHYCMRVRLRMFASQELCPGP